MEIVNNKRRVNLKWVLVRIMLIAYDIVAVNASFYIAILTRFYIQNEMHVAGVLYVEAFGFYAPFYTIFCLIVFSCFRLYSGMWRYIGINDMNRILMANFVTLVGHIVGSVLFVKRMPITFYAIGTVIQVFMIAGIRLSYRMFLFEKEHFTSGNKATLNAMVIGSDVPVYNVQQQLKRGNIVNPVCILNYKSSGVNSMLDGMPYYYGLDNFKRAIEKHQVKEVVVADVMMPRETRETIKKYCQELGVEVNDYSVFFQNSGSSITLKSLVEYTSGPVALNIDGAVDHYSDGIQALMNASGNYSVKSISAKDDELVVTLNSRKVITNDLNAEWVKKHTENGEEISFF